MCGEQTHQHQHQHQVQQEPKQVSKPAEEQVSTSDAIENDAQNERKEQPASKKLQRDRVHA